MTIHRPITAIVGFCLLGQSVAQSIEQAFGGIGNNSVQVIFDDTLADRILLGGGFTELNGSNVSVGIVSTDHVQVESFGCGIEWDCISPLGQAGSFAKVRSVAFHDGSLFIGGDFTLADWTLVNFIARWDGTAWLSLGTGTDGPVWGLKSCPDGLYVAGWFNYADTVEARGLARWDGTQWHSVHNLPLWNNNVNGVYDVAVYNGTVYIGGNFSNGSNINDFAYFDGNQWVSPGGGLLGTFSQVNHLRVHDSLLYIIGSFADSPPNGVAANPGSGIVTWNGSTFAELGGGTSGSSNAAVIDATWINDTLYALGRFNMIGGVPCSRLAYWDGLHWCCMTPQGFWSQGEPVSIGTWRDSLYLGGNFIEAGGDQIYRIAKWIGGSQADTCQVITGISENLNATNQLLAWPNPVLDVLHLNNTLPAYITITDAIGRQVMTVQVPARGLVPVEALASGCYVLHLRSAQQQPLGVMRFAKE